MTLTSGLGENTSFERLIPNDTTIAAMRETQRADLPSVGTVTELMVKLNAQLPLLSRELFQEK